MTITLHDARLPDGLRVYVIGDVHGERDQAADILNRIAADRARRPVGDWREIWLGDLIDRGPDSAGVLDLVIRPEDRDRRITILGNHDAFMRDFLASGDPVVLEQWLRNGGVHACASWDIDMMTLDDTVSRHGAGALRELLANVVPDAHQRLLRAMPLHAVLGDFAFVHAGIRPGVPMDQQREGDLIWIREDFLHHPGPHEHVVVHGHTPCAEIEVLPQRICLDTGAGKGGHLSCVVIEGGAVWRLDPDGVTEI